LNLIAHVLSEALMRVVQKLTSLHFSVPSMRHVPIVTLTMASLSTVDMKLIDSLFGMYGGYPRNVAQQEAINKAVGR
jgi:hypothetical protein